MENVTIDDVQRWIDNGKKDGAIEDCLFNVLILDKNYKTEVFTLLSSAAGDFNMVDTVQGCWNLNDDWLEFKAPALVTWGGVYPVEWNIHDVYRLRELYIDRKIYINVYHRVGDKYEPIT